MRNCRRGHASAGEVDRRRGKVGGRQGALLSTEPCNSSTQTALQNPVPQVHMPRCYSTQPLLTFVGCPKLIAACRHCCHSAAAQPLLLLLLLL